MTLVFSRPDNTVHLTSLQYLNKVNTSLEYSLLFRRFRTPVALWFESFGVGEVGVGKRNKVH